MPKKVSKKAAKHNAQILIEDLYNILMEDIEPELTTDAIPLIDEMYADESPEEKKARGKRYARALQEMQERLKDITDKWKEGLKAVKHQLMEYFEDMESESVTEYLSDLESSIQKS